MDFHEEQRAVWGEGNDAFRQAYDHVKEVDAEMLKRVAVEVSAGIPAEALYDLCLDGYLHKENPRAEQVLARMAEAKPKVVARLDKALKFGTPTHLLPWSVVNTMLRGWGATAGQEDAAESAPGAGNV